MAHLGAEDGMGLLFMGLTGGGEGCEANRAAGGRGHSRARAKPHSEPTQRHRWPRWPHLEGKGLVFCSPAPVSHWRRSVQSMPEGDGLAPVWYRAVFQKRGQLCVALDSVPSSWERVWARPRWHPLKWACLGVLDLRWQRNKVLTRNW